MTNMPYFGSIGIDAPRRLTALFDALAQRAVT